MRSHCGTKSWGTKRWFALAALLVAIGGGASSARAQAALSDDDDDQPPPDTAPSVSAEADKAHFGVGLRLREVFIPKGLIELFVERAAGGGNHLGYGLEVVRRKGNFEISLGFEYESLAAGDGVWIDKGDQIPTDDPDLVEFDNFGWVGADVSFIWQQELAKMVALRYGAGIGLGVILGDVLRTDYHCTTDDVNSCSNDTTGANQRTPEDAIPPVFPIINFLIGVQIRPTDNIAINIEGGLRTLPFLGTTVAYYF
jgi:hypothetical protein